MAIRRTLGGTLLALGATVALFSALLTSWFAAELLREGFYFAFGDPGEVRAILGVLAVGLLALAAGVLAAAAGRWVLGRRAAI